MKKYIEALKKCSLFSNIESENFETVLNCLGARVVKFDKKYTILAEGSEAKYIGIILSGSAQIFQVDYYGNRNIIGSLTVGDMFGESFAAAGIRRLPVSVVASDDSEVMLIAKRTGKSSFEIPFDRQELADYLGVDRSGLSAEISKLRKEGIIESKKNYFKLL